MKYHPDHIGMNNHTVLHNLFKYFEKKCTQKHLYFTFLPRFMVKERYFKYFE